MRAILRRDEPEDVYRELIDGLADNVTPMVVLCLLLVTAGNYILTIDPDVRVLTATVIGAAASLVKIALILYHRHCRLAYKQGPIDRVSRIERQHAATTIAVGLSVGSFCATVYTLPQVVLHLIPLCIAFGYSAGLIARVSIRPRIAAGAIFSLCAPSAVTLAMLDAEHRVVALIFSIFVCAGFQSVGFVYETSWRAVTLRLRMETLAWHDPLTGLLNRLGLRKAAEALARHDQRMVAVHAFDLDGFKAINDAYGHAAGDRLLTVLATRIRSVVPAGTIVARTGGDEFVVVQLDITDDGDARRLAHRIHQQLTHPCDIECCTAVSIGLSLGYAIGPLPQSGLDDLIQRADLQSYAVKRDGGGTRADRERQDHPGGPLPATPPQRPFRLDNEYASDGGLPTPDTA